MQEYHKIPTAWKRDPDTKHRTLLEGQWATPELACLAGCQWAWTEKVDGTNIRVMWDGNTRVTFGGRTERAQIPATLVAALQEEFPPEKFYGRDEMCLYGEGYGSKIQKGGGNYRPDQGFVLFDVRVGEWWLKREVVESFAGELDVEHVPQIGCGTLNEAINYVRGGSLQSTWGDFQAEGLVMRPHVELQDRAGKRIIAKIKTKDFAGD